MKSAIDGRFASPYYEIAPVNYIPTVFLIGENRTEVSVEIFNSSNCISGLTRGYDSSVGPLPVGGFIPVPTPAGSATTMHIPTILAGVFEGPAAGAGRCYLWGFRLLRAKLTQTQWLNSCSPIPLSLFYLVYSLV